MIEEKCLHRKHRVTNEHALAKVCEVTLNTTLSQKNVKYADKEVQGELDD